MSERFDELPAASDVILHIWRPAIPT